MTERLVPAISLRGAAPEYSIQLIPTNEAFADYENRKDEIRKELVEAAEHAGFLTLVDHDITVAEIEAQFALAKKFFDLPTEVKAQNPHSVKDNNGYEFKVSLSKDIRTYTSNNISVPSSAKHRSSRPKRVSLAPTWFSMAQ
jgi:isopenicillin N synthase-like dioxygenase